MGSVVACRRGDRLGNKLEKAREIAESEEEEVCVECEEREADAEVGGCVAGEVVTFSL